jgi:ATP-dependent helicase/nuclease subunit A
MEPAMSSPASELTSLVVRAGAGAGKTTRLVSQVLMVATDHYAATKTYPNLMLTTFTRKATGELRERLMLEAVKKKDESLLEYLSGPQLHVSTIHGVLSVFLKRFGHLAGLDNAFQMVSPAHTQRLAKSILRKLVLESDQASELVTASGFNKLCKLLMTLSGQLFENSSLQPCSVETMAEVWKTHWAKFADEAVPELRGLLAETDNEKYTEYIQIVLQVIEDFQSEQQPTSELLQRGLARLPSKPRINAKNPAIGKDKDNQLKEIVNELKKTAALPEMDPKHWNQLAKWYEQLHAVATDFQQKWYEAKLEKAMLDSDDLESFTLHILKKHPELGEAFSEETDYWLIDEYQDTSPLQVRILDALSRGRSQFIVGDPQQSIYLFRGSDVSVFRAQEQRMLAGEGKLDRLEQNWRSKPELLEFFNSLFTSMGESFAAMLPREAVTDPKQIVATVAVTSDSDFEAEPKSQLCSIARHIASKLEDGARYDQICILARTNAQLKEVAKYLKGKGFPTHLHASGGFFGRREILDALSLLKFLVNPLDNKNLVALLRTPWMRVDDQTLSEWVLPLKGAYWPQLKASQPENNVVVKLSEALEMTETTGLVWVFEDLLMSLGLFDFCRFQDATGRRESNLWKLLHALKEEEKMPGFSYLNFIAGASLSDEGEEFESESDAIASLEPNHIQLMTVHASKGLQFEHVILPGLEKGSRPPRSKIVEVDNDRAVWSAPMPVGENDEWSGSPVDLEGKRAQKQMELEESLRVFYVAATRAKTSIFMSWNEGKVKPDSWAARVPFATDEDKVLSFEKFSIEILRSPFAEVDRKLSEGKTKQVRPMYAAEFKAQALTQKSVTKMVKDQIESAVPQPSEKAGSSEVVVPKNLLPKIYRKTADGVYFHRVMESLYYDNQFDFRPIAEHWFHKDAATVISAVEWTLKLDQPPMAKLLESGFVEWGFQYLQNNEIVEGQIDLWGLIDDRIWLVDYKTGRKEEQDKALLQLDIYEKALRAAGYDQPIEKVVLFPMDQLIVT